MQLAGYESPISSMRDHRSLVAWQVARALVSQVMAISRKHYHPRVSIIFSQMQSASLSVQLNIAEGYARQSVTCHLSSSSTTRSISRTLL
jgi:hypothetical protein